MLGSGSRAVTGRDHSCLPGGRGRVLDYDDLTHYPKVVGSLRKTIELMSRIDAVDRA